MRRACVGAVAIWTCLAPACGGDDGGSGIDHEGEAGRPVPVHFDGWVPGVDATLGDHATSRFLIDSGAPVSLVDTDDFSDLATGWYDLDLQVGELTFPATEVGAYDLFTGDQTGPDALTGIIGGNVLTSFALSLDYQGQRVWLEDGEPAALPDELAAGAVGDPIEVGARVAGGGTFSIAGERRVIDATRFLVRAAAEDMDDATEGFWLLVDSGASSVTLSNQLLDLLGDQGRPRLEGIPVGTVSGQQTGFITRLWSLRIGDAEASATRVEQTSVPALVLPDDSIFASISDEVGLDVMGVVGGTFLRWYVATLDYPGERLRLLPYTSTGHIDPDEFIGVGFELATDGAVWVVSTVYPGTDAEAEGVAEGETVLEVAGQRVAGLSFADLNQLFAGFGVGDEVPIGLARGGELVELAIEVEDLLPEFEAPP